MIGRRCRVYRRTLSALAEKKRKVMSKCPKRQSAVPMVLCVELPNGMLTRFESAALRLIPVDKLPEGFERYGNGVTRFQDLSPEARAASASVGYVACGSELIRAFQTQASEADRITDRLSDACFDAAYALGIEEATRRTGGSVVSS